MGERDEIHLDEWRCYPLTRDHKPKGEKELARIEAVGGKVVNKKGVP